MPYPPLKNICFALLLFGGMCCIGAGFGYYYLIGLLKQIDNHTPSIHVSLSSASSILMVFPAVGLWAYAAYLSYRKISHTARINMALLALLLLTLISANLWMDSYIHTVAERYGYHECKSLYQCRASVTQHSSYCLMTFTRPGYCPNSIKEDTL